MYIHFVQPVHTGLGENSSKDVNANEIPNIKTDILLITYDPAGFVINPLYPHLG